METKIKIGVSACLLGEKVRYNGGHKLDRFITDTLGKYAEYLPLCPESECGLGIPRESMRLEGDSDSPRLVGNQTKTDYTEKMIKWAEKRVAELEKENLCAFIFKSGSPSSGMERVKVYNEKGVPKKNSAGIFAKIFMNHFKLLPVEEDGRLYDPKLRENFIESIFVYERWRKLLAEKRTRGGLVDFHTQHKLLILSHSEKHYREMGKLVAQAKDMRESELFEKYQILLLESLRLKTTVSKNINVLQHVMGYFKKQLSPDEKKEVLEIFENYKKGNVPLIVPITLINHYVRKYAQNYLKSQYYLNPHPLELKLRNHV